MEEADVEQRMIEMSLSQNEFRINESVGHACEMSIVLDNEKLTTSKALCRFAKFSLPSMLNLLCKRSIDSASFLFIARLDDPVYVAGVGLAFTTCGIVVSSMSIGLGYALETLASHAFGSKKNYLAGCYYNRAIVIATVMYIIQAVIIWNTETLLRWAGQPEDSSHYGGVFNRCYMIGLYLWAQCELLRRFLNAQGVFYLQTTVQIIVVLAHISLLYIMVAHFDLGLYGVAIVSTMTYTLSFVITAVYITVRKDKVKPGSWHCINKDSFIGICEYMKIGVPSILMICLQIMCFESLTLMAGYLGVIEQGTSFIVLYLGSFAYMLAIGMSIAATNLVGNSLGANKPDEAKIYANIAILSSTWLAACIVALFLVFEKEIPLLMTSHVEIQEQLFAMMPVVILVITPDFIQGVAGGVIVAMGYQQFGTYSCLVAYWCVGIPLSYTLTFHYGYGVQGLWIGASIGLIVLAVCYLLLIYSSNWAKLATEISLKIQRASNDLDQGSDH